MPADPGELPAFDAATFFAVTFAGADFLAVVLVGVVLIGAAVAAVALTVASAAVVVESASSPAGSVGSSTGSAVRDVEPVPLLFTRWSREVPGRLGALLRDRELAIQLLPREVGAGWA
ncbi:MAG: hypothetical protein M3R66_09620 [Actinomycetota bacterium]|nr:hypothetical protein [Actinomycetota bacterium]